MSKESLTFCSPPSLPPRPNPGQRKREEILVDMSRVHEITNSAISKFIGRGEDVKSLKSKSDGLGDVSGMFKKKAKETKVESQDKNVKVRWLILVISTLSDFTF